MRRWCERRVAMPHWIEITLILIAVALAALYIGRITLKAFKGRCGGCGFGGGKTDAGDDDRPVELTINRKPVE